MNITNSDLNIDEEEDFFASLNLSTQQTLSVAQTLRVGSTGFGKLSLENGAKVACASGVIGENGNATGLVKVSGDGSIWDTSGSLTVGGTTAGAGGDGIVSLNTGGTITATHLDTSNGTFAFIGGTLESFSITGDLVNIGGTLAPGASPGRLSITGDYTQLADATLAMELGGKEAGENYDVLAVDGTLPLAGTLDILWYDDFTALVNDTFDILDWAVLAGTLDTINTPELTDDTLVWDLSNLYVDGTITVVSTSPVPIPSTLMLLGSGLVTLACWRRRTLSTAPPSAQ